MLGILNSDPASNIHIPGSQVLFWMEHYESSAPSHWGGGGCYRHLNTRLTPHKQRLHLDLNNPPNPWQQPFCEPSVEQLAASSSEQSTGGAMRWCDVNTAQWDVKCADMIPPRHVHAIFTMLGKGLLGPPRAFSLLKTHTIAFTVKNLSCDAMLDTVK